MAACGSAQAATTYYVRVDGGTAAQCTGRADAPYPGSGSAQACAWNSPHAALPATGARIAGGDTLIIGSGSYMIGWGAPGAAGGRCYDGGHYDCYLSPVPSGPSATAKTRILGNCAAPPTLWGTERTYNVLNLDDSANVEVGCLDITDHSDCVEGHSDSAARCQRDTAPYGQWASEGISAQRAKNIWLHDVNVHGLAHTGIYAGGLNTWTMDRVKIVANGWVGWDGDIGSGSSNSGPIVMRNIEIAWNGCGERWQTKTPWACWAQQGGGYGDGLGVAGSGGQWLIEDAFVHHNTSDGIDLLYLDGLPGTSVTIRRAYAVGNAGNQIKTKGAALIENSVVVGNCAYFSGRDDMIAGDQCRAMGNALSIGLSDGQDATIRQNTITGQGDCLILTGGGSSASHVYIQNNALLGQPDYTANGNEQTCAQYADSSPAAVSFSGNLIYNVKNGMCPNGSICSDPKLTNETMAAFDATPIKGSPLIDRVAMIAGVNTDFYLAPRPAGAAADIGAVEVQPSMPLADFNGDGKSDILWRNETSGSNSLWFSANSASQKSLSGNANGWEAVGVGDFDGDGVSDILWRNSDSGANTIWRSGNSSNLMTVTGVANPAWKVVGVGDFNHDNVSDIVWRNIQTGADVVWLSADSNRGMAVASVTDTSWQIVAVGDFDGDNTSDLLWRNLNSGANTIWKSGLSSAQITLPRIATEWSIVGAGDFNNDGVSDVVWRDGVNGANTIWLSANIGTRLSVIGVTNQTWKITVGDYDGDGACDLLWRNVQTGNNVIWKSAQASNRQAVTTAGNAWTITAS